MFDLLGQIKEFVALFLCNCPNKLDRMMGHFYNLSTRVIPYDLSGTLFSFKWYARFTLVVRLFHLSGTGYATSLDNVFYIAQIIIRKVFFRAERYIAAFHNKVLSVFNVCLYDFPYYRSKKYRFYLLYFSQIIE